MDSQNQNDKGGKDKPKDPITPEALERIEKGKDDEFKERAEKALEKNIEKGLVDPPQSK